MVNGVTQLRPLRIHQALHGYADGHRQLASSVTLKGRDFKTMLILSDASGPSARIKEQGYLTGYPLPDSGFYALGRTWAASEMSRPGCVWTHTILIDFADLATLGSVECLRQLFRKPRPFADDKSTFCEQIAFDTSIPRVDVPCDTTVMAFLKSVIWKMYSKPRTPLFVIDPQSFDPEAWVLKIWSQQWPRLRRTFRFCTQSYADRSTNADLFDFQLVPSTDSKLRLLALDDTEQIPNPIPVWLKDAIYDVTENDHQTLRAFFHRIGGDVEGGRDAYIPLCNLHHLLTSGTNESNSIDEAINILSKPPWQTGARIVRSLTVSQAAEKADMLNHNSLNFVVQNIDLLDENCSILIERVGKAWWTNTPSEVIRWLNDSGPINILAQRTIDNLSDAEILNSLQKEEQLFPKILDVRPSIVAIPEFWQTVGSVAVSNSFRVVINNLRLLELALEAMIKSGVHHLAQAAVKHVGASQALKATIKHLEAHPQENNSTTCTEWITTCIEDPASIAETLSSGVVHRRETLLFIARATHPDTVPNEFGEDPWHTAMKTTKGSLPREERLYLAAYLLARALGDKSTEPSILLALSFDEVYTAAQDSRLPDDAWELLKARLPWSSKWFDWDRCQRLRAAVIDAFIQGRIPQNNLGAITSSTIILEHLLEEASRTRSETVLIDFAKRFKKEKQKKAKKDISAAARRKK